MKKLLDISIDKSLDWIYDHLDFFLLSHGSSNDVSLLDTERKQLGELAILLTISKRNTRYKNDSRVLGIAKFIEKICSTDNFYFDITRNLNLFPFYLMLYNGLSASGIEIKDFKKQLESIVNANFMDCIERTAWNQIDFRYQLDIAEINHNMLPYDKLYIASSMYHLPNPIHTRDIDIYAITHILFHLTSFGDRNIDEMLGTRKEKTKEYIGFLMTKYALVEDWDLLGELLICCHNLHYRTHPLYKECWSRFLNSQNAEGDFTSRYIQESLKKGDVVEKKDRFDVNYHPTLVGLFACLLEYEFLAEAA